MLLYFITLVVGYVVGSISFAQIVAKRHGIDILKEGSGNPGATNVKRVVGKSAGNLVFILDALKGFIVAFWPVLLPVCCVTPGDAFSLGLTGFAAGMIGHSFSIFLRFKGGRGVAIAMGGLIALMPMVFLAGAVVWATAFYTTRYVSLASILFGLSIPVSAWFLMPNPLAYYFSWVLALFILIRHRQNIKRLLAGTENKFVKKK